MKMHANAINKNLNTIQLAQTLWQKARKQAGVRKDLRVNQSQKQNEDDDLQLLQKIPIPFLE